MDDAHRAIRQAIADEAARISGHVVPIDAPADFDLLGNGTVDSFGLVELLAGVEERFGVEIDFDELDPDDMTMVGPLTTYFASRLSLEEA